jgi:hypothetical protein
VSGEVYEPLRNNHKVVSVADTWPPSIAPPVAHEGFSVTHFFTVRDHITAGAPCFLGISEVVLLQDAKFDHESGALTVELSNRKASPVTCVSQFQEDALVVDRCRESASGHKFPFAS